MPLPMMGARQPWSHRLYYPSVASFPVPDVQQAAAAAAALRGAAAAAGRGAAATPPPAPAAAPPPQPQQPPQSQSAPPAKGKRGKERVVCDLAKLSDALTTLAHSTALGAKLNVQGAAKKAGIKGCRTPCDTVVAL